MCTPWLRISPRGNRSGPSYTHPRLVKRRQERPRIPLPPPPPHLGQNVFSIPLHLRNYPARSLSILMPRPPDQQLQHQRSEIDPLLRKPVIHPPPVRLLTLSAHNPSLRQPPQPIGQNISGDPLARLLKFLKRPISPHHQIANDEQRPPIPKPLQRNADRASGTPLKTRFFRSPHNPQSIKYNLHNASNRKFGFVVFLREPLWPWWLKGFANRANQPWNEKTKHQKRPAEKPAFPSRFSDSYGLPNRSDMVLVLASQAWFKQGSLKPPSMVLKSEK